MFGGGGGGGGGGLGRIAPSAPLIHTLSYAFHKSFQVCMWNEHHYQVVQYNCTVNFTINPKPGNCSHRVFLILYCSYSYVGPTHQVVVYSTPQLLLPVVQGQIQENRKGGVQMHAKRRVQNN